MSYCCYFWNACTQIKTSSQHTIPSFFKTQLVTHSFCSLAHNVPLSSCCMPGTQLGEPGHHGTGYGVGVLHGWAEPNAVLVFSPTIWQGSCRLGLSHSGQQPGAGTSRQESHLAVIPARVDPASSGLWWLWAPKTVLCTCPIGD